MTAIGRTSGKPRSVILGYVEDGADLVVLAMNGWDEGDPSWFLNLQSNADAEVRLAEQPARRVRAREAVGVERDRLWQLWLDVDPMLDAYAEQRSTHTPVVVLESA